MPKKSMSKEDILEKYGDIISEIVNEKLKQNTVKQNVVKKQDLKNNDVVIGRKHKQLCVEPVISTFKRHRSRATSGTLSFKIKPN